MRLEGYDRYAIYWAPEAGSALAKAGATWLGWDAEHRKRIPLPIELDGVTAGARRYGFHATLKPPFRLASGVDSTSLSEGIAELAACRRAFTAPGFAVDAALGFAALRPSRPCPDLDALAGACLTQLDWARAPLTGPEIAKRRSARLTAAQGAQLLRWGYPYVLGDFRFHLTLSRALSAVEEFPLLAEAESHFASSLPASLAIREICLFGDPGNGENFHLLQRFPFEG